MSSNVHLYVRKYIIHGEFTRWMIVKVSERVTISVVALRNGLLMAVIAKTHVPTALLHEGSDLVSGADAHMALFFHIVWITLSPELGWSPDLSFLFFFILTPIFDFFAQVLFLLSLCTFSFLCLCLVLVALNSTDIRLFSPVLRLF